MDDRAFDAWVQVIFEHLAGEGSPLATLEPDYVMFCANLVAAEVANQAGRIRWRTGRTTLRDELLNEGIYELHEENDAGEVRVSLRPEWRQILAMKFATPPAEKRGRGRPKTSADRYGLVAQVFNVYPKGTAKLSREWGSHFEDTVRLALALAGDKISDVYEEIRAAKAMPGWPDPDAQ